MSDASVGRSGELHSGVLEEPARVALVKLLEQLNRGPLPRSLQEDARLLCLELDAIAASGHLLQELQGSLWTRSFFNELVAQLDRRSS